MNQYLALLKNPSWDVAFLILLMAGVFFWGMSGGKKKILLAILAIYALNVLFPYIPLDSVLVGRSAREIMLINGSLFLALLALLGVFLSRAFHGMTSREELWWEILLLSILGSGFLVISIINLAPAGAGYAALELSPITAKLFTHTYSQWWVILPLFGVLFL